MMKLLNDTWVLDVTSQTWSVLEFEGMWVPPARVSHAMQCAERLNVLLYGGSGEDGIHLEEMYVLQLEPTDPVINIVVETEEFEQGLN